MQSGCVLGPSSQGHHLDARPLQPQLDCSATKHTHANCGPHLRAQAEEGSPIVHVVESMRFAAEDHDRLLAECALLKARSSCDACIFDLDLDMTETCQGRSAYSVPRWVAA